MPHLNRRQALALGLASLAAGAASRVGAQSPSGPAFKGVNLAGGDFGSAIPGILNTDYVYPFNAEIDYYLGKKMNAFRLPFKWERIQPELDGSFKAPDITELDRIVDYATARGAVVLLDPHNYGRRKVGGEEFIIGETSTVASDHFARFWERLATRYRDNDRVMFGLMNEPHDQNTTILVSVLNHAIRAIRGAGAANLILVPGNAYTGAHSWVGSGNAEAMLQIEDSGGNYAFEVHQYLDYNSSGTDTTCTVGSGSTRLDVFTDWARTNNVKGFLGEFSGAANATCAAELTALMQHMADNADIWLGWTYWAGGPWWGEEPFTIAPARIEAPVDRPQMAVLEPFL